MARPKKDENKPIAPAQQQQMPLQQVQHFQPQQILNGPSPVMAPAPKINNAPVINIADFVRVRGKFVFHHQLPTDSLFPYAR